MAVFATLFTVSMSRMTSDASEREFQDIGWWDKGPDEEFLSAGKGTSLQKVSLL